MVFVLFSLHISLLHDVLLFFPVYFCVAFLQPAALQTRGKKPHRKMKKIPCRCQAHWAVPGVILIWGILVLLLQEVSVSQPFTVIMRWGMSLMMTLCRNLGNVLDTLAAHIPPSEWPLKNYLHPADFLVHPYLIHPLHRDVSTFQHFLVGKVPISLLPGIIQIFNKQLSGGKRQKYLHDKKLHILHRYTYTLIANYYVLNSRKW